MSTLKLTLGEPPEVIFEEHKGKSCYMLKFPGGRLHLDDKPEIKGMYASEFYDTQNHGPREEAMRTIKEYYRVPDEAKFTESKDTPSRTWVRWYWTWFLLEVK